VFALVKSRGAVICFVVVVVHTQHISFFSQGELIGPNHLLVGPKDYTKAPDQQTVKEEAVKAYMESPMEGYCNSTRDFFSEIVASTFEHQSHLAVDFQS
jgi:hypothetical protein